MIIVHHLQFLGQIHCAILLFAGHLMASGFSTVQAVDLKILRSFSRL